MNETQIESFWDHHPCGDSQVGGLDRYRGDYEAFFREYDAYRYAHEGHILTCLDAIDFRGKQVLEIGLGEGADSEQIIRRGALWSGLDLTAESVDRVKTRLALRELPYQEIKQGSVLQIPFPDDHFDLVFSHGVLHHVPDIEMAQREIHRVLRPSGQLILMVYAKWSLNYLVSIAVVRRAGLLALYLMHADVGGIYGQHLANARTTGLREYLRLENFIHSNTDGPLNPYSKVYDDAAIRCDFPLFTVTRSYQRFMHAPPLPVRRLPLQRMLGWHLWAHLTPR